MIAKADLDHCRAAIRTGSLSFYTASLLLPARVRDPALVLYAFCRLADDAVDLREDKAAAVLTLRDRLEGVYNGRPRDEPIDRAFAAMVEEQDMPRALPEALLEGLAWDAIERRYQTENDLMAYCARVASAVGAMMCVLMGARSADALARATDLGLGMQLTNIARDVGEDAHAGRLYLPLDWLAEEGVDADAFMRDPQPTPEIRRLTKRLLKTGEERYANARAGVAALPRDCRFGIYAALLIYRGIGAEIRRAQYDSITRRAHTSKRQKAMWIGEAALRTGVVFATPRSAILHRRPHDETRFLVEAAHRDDPTARSRADALMSVFAQLEARDRARRSELMNGPTGAT